MPTRGLIFDDWSLSKSDVNNHTIGKWGECLVQLYTYSKVPADPSTYYLVGQINVPKSYEGVIIESRKAKLKGMEPPKDYQKFEMEWGDFNRRYTVYASSKDALPAFELLNPSFMAKLYDKNLDYNVEAADNTIYIFASIGETRREDYAELLGVLDDAFKELKM